MCIFNRHFNPTGATNVFEKLTTLADALSICDSCPSCLLYILRGMLFGILHP